MWNRWSFPPKTVQTVESTHPAWVHPQPSPSAPSSDSGRWFLPFLHADSNSKYLRKGQHLPFDLSGRRSLWSQQENITSNNQSKETNSFQRHAGSESPRNSVPKPLASLPSQHPLSGAYRRKPK